MGLVSLTDPVNGAVADATVIATNNHAIEAVVNGGLDDTNIISSADIAVSKLAAGTNGQVLTTTGGVPVWGSAAAGETTYRKTTSKAVNTTTTATDLLNGEITVVGGVMGISGVCRLTAWGDFLNNSGGGVAAPRFQLVFGGTTLLDTGAGAQVAANASRGGWRVVAEILNLGSASAQMTSMFTAIGGPGAFSGTVTWTTGEGGGVSNGTSATQTGIRTSTTVDTSAACALLLNVINGSSSASYETKLYGALVEIV